MFASESCRSPCPSRTRVFHVTLRNRPFVLCCKGCFTTEINLKPLLTDFSYCCVLFWRHFCYLLLWGFNVLLFAYALVKHPGTQCAGALVHSGLAIVYVCCLYLCGAVLMHLRLVCRSPGVFPHAYDALMQCSLVCLPGPMRRLFPGGTPSAPRGPGSTRDEAV